MNFRKQVTLNDHFHTIHSSVLQVIFVDTDIRKRYATKNGCWFAANSSFSCSKTQNSFQLTISSCSQKPFYNLELNN